jgi:hypothetical protein
MLKDNLSNKNIAIIGYQTLTSRIIVKQLFQNIDQRFLFIEVGKDSPRRAKFISDPYFTAEERLALQNRVDYVALSDVAQFASEKYFGRIDLLLSLF